MQRGEKLRSSPDLAAKNVHEKGDYSVKIELIRKNGDPSRNQRYKSTRNQLTGFRQYENKQKRKHLLTSKI